MIKYRRKNRLGKADQPLVSRGRSRSRKESEDLSKNPCTLHRERERESPISLPLSSTLRRKEKGKRARISFRESRGTHSGCQQTRARNAATKRARGSFVCVADEKPTVSEFPSTDVSLSPFARLCNSTPCWLTGW